MRRAQRTLQFPDPIRRGGVTHRRRPRDTSCTVSNHTAARCDRRTLCDSSALPVRTGFTCRTSADILPEQYRPRRRPLRRVCKRTLSVGNKYQLSEHATTAKQVRKRLRCAPGFYSLSLGRAIALMVYFPLSTGRAPTPTYRPHCDHSPGLRRSYRRTRAGNIASVIAERAERTRARSAHRLKANAGGIPWTIQRLVRFT
jgi:hypothetical protein